MHALIVGITAPLTFIGLIVLTALGHAVPSQQMWYVVSPYFGFATALIGLICFFTLIHGLVYDVWLDYKYGMENR